MAKFYKTDNQWLGPVNIKYPFGNEGSEEDPSYYVDTFGYKYRLLQDESGHKFFYNFVLKRIEEIKDEFEGDSWKDLVMNRIISTENKYFWCFIDPYGTIYSFDGGRFSHDFIGLALWGKNSSQLIESNPPFLHFPFHQYVVPPNIFSITPEQIIAARDHIKKHNISSGTWNKLEIDLANAYKEAIYKPNIKTATNKKLYVGKFDEDDKFIDHIDLLDHEELDFLQFYALTTLPFVFRKEILDRFPDFEFIRAKSNEQEYTIAIDQLNDTYYVFQ